ncbi:hypothetical protein [Haloarcula halophila]|uniref:hypothetical protein n=1 Tax=Halomicroarcula sp. GCM10025335 TaxID=3252668 RepID=UPI00360D8AED
MATTTDSCDPELVATIQDVTEGDILVVNDDHRTWEVTDVVERPIDDPTDDRQHKIVLRLTSGQSVFGLELTDYGDCHEATLHVLETSDWTEGNHTEAVHSVEVLTQQVPWVVVSRTEGQVYHFPDPEAAAYGEAAPACGAGNGDSEFRIARITAVVPMYGGCKECLREARPVTLETVRCPSCERPLCTGILRGGGVDAVEGLAITCPDQTCGFEGVVDASLVSGFA